MGLGFKVEGLGFMRNHNTEPEESGDKADNCLQLGLSFLPALRRFQGFRFVKAKDGPRALVLTSYS